MFRLNHISESAELDIFQELIECVDGKSRWIWEQEGLPKLLPENTDGEVRSATWMTGLLNCLKCWSEEFDPALMIALA